MANPILASALALFFLVGCCLILFKLIRTQLAGVYLAFFAFISFLSVQTGWGLAFNVSSNVFFYFWAVTLPLFWFLEIVAVRQLCGLVLERYPGLRTAGRWGMYAGVVISTGISILTVLSHVPLRQKSRLLTYWFPADRGVSFGLAVFLLFMMFLVGRFPVKLNKNVIVHTVVYTLFFLNNALYTLLQTYYGVEKAPVLDLVNLGISAACAWLWFILLSRKGEETRMNLPHYTPEEEERILAKLEALNETLLKVSRN